MDGHLDRLPVPVIVRIAGLSAEVMKPFGSRSCIDQARTLLRLESDLESLRSRVVDRLHAQIKGAPPKVRNALLAIKRDCYNGRGLSTRKDSPEWSAFEGVAPELATCIAKLEMDLAAKRKVFEEIFHSEHARETRHLLNLLDDENLQQGLALASPVVMSGVDRLRRPFESYKRKERRLIQSLLRYVSRAALKLSPFSTFTRLGLGVVGEGATPAAGRLMLLGTAQDELHRVKKHVVVKYHLLLLNFRPFRDRLRIQLNPSVERIGQDRYRFIRPFHWRLNQEAREFRYFNEDQISASLRGVLIEELQALLQVDRQYDEVVQLLSKKLSSAPATIESVIQKLSGLGFLLLLFPWPTNDLDPERRLLDFLEQVAQEGPLEEFARTFERLLDLRDASPPSVERLRGYREIDALRLKCFRILTEATGLPEIKEDASDRQIHEDVFIVPRVERVDQESAVARIPWRSVEEAFASARPMVLYSDLNYTRYEFLHSLGALAKRNWPGQQTVGFLDLFHAAQPLWGEYVKAATTAITEWVPDLWNPFELEEIAALNRLRNQVLKDMERCLHEEGDDLVLDRAEAERAVARIPDVYVPTFGPCLFVQPATPDGDLWMLNHMLDGTGRFSNRYTTVMKGRMRDRFSSYLAQDGTAVLFGERAEVIEILCARDDHLNVHKVQTARVVEMPGENPALPPERRLGVRDLVVRLDGPLPALADRSGQRLVPIFLGTNGLVGMPTLVRFLSRFGIGEFRLMHPPRPPQRRQHGVQTFRRLRIGNLVLRRRLWVFSSAAVLDDPAGSSDAEFFLAVNRWRLEHCVPDQVFVSEKLQVEFKLWPIHKPQYIDFTSPSFVPIFRCALASSRDELKLEEVLPTPEAFPTDEGGRRWAFEAQLENVAFDRIRPWKVASRDRSSEFSRGQLPPSGKLVLTNRA
jgi:hypothetical protein